MNEPKGGQFIAMYVHRNRNSGFVSTRSMNETKGGQYIAMYVHRSRNSEFLSTGSMNGPKKCNPVAQLHIKEIDADYRANKM